MFFPAFEKEPHPNTVLNAAKVRAIRKIYRPYSRAFGAKALANQFGVTQNHIYQITRRKRWRHVR